VVGEKLLLMDRKIPVEYIQHLAFHPTDVPMLEKLGTLRPSDVFHRLIVEVLASEHESSNEDPLASPFFGGYPQVGLRSLDIDQSDEHDCYADFGHVDHPRHEFVVFLPLIP